MTKSGILRVPCVVLMMSISAGAAAQVPDVGQVEAGLKNQSQRIDEIERQLDSKERSREQLNAYLQTLLGDVKQANSDAKTLTEASKQVEARLLALGPPPGEDEPPETAAVRALRRKLTADSSRLSGLAKLADLNGKSIEELIGRIEAESRALRLSEITERGVSPTLPRFWSAAAGEIPPALDYRVSTWSTHWRAATQKTTWPANLALLLVALALAIALLFAPRWRGWRQLGDALEGKAEPSRMDKTRRVALASFSRSLVVAVAGGLLYVAGLEAGLVSATNSELARRLWLGFTAWTIVWWYARGVFSPGLPAWRLAPCGDQAAPRLQRLLVAGYTVLLADRLGAALEPPNGATEAMLALQVVTATLFGVLMWFFLSPKLWHTDEPANAADPKPSPAWHREALRRGGRFFAVAMLILLGLGYVPLSSFLFQRLALLFLFFVVFWCLRRTVLWGVSRLPAISPKDGTPSTQENPEAHSESLGFWLRLAAELLLFVLAFPLFMLVFGFDWLDVQRVLYRFTSDIHLGAVSISFPNLLIAVVAFFLINTGTRAATNILGRELAKSAPIEDGAQNSITTLINYVGLVIAILVALPIAGIGFSKLAIIAGALSVGIGFGLQNIVNNFVSGLILLFERPIKAGDWIIIESGQGYVKHIGVRATEIETFDHASIIVPNAELVSSSVQNWFHGNRLGRIRFTVGVGYGSDPEVVKKALLQCAADHESIMPYPAPEVTFHDFGDSALVFQLRAHLRNYDSAYRIQSDLRFAIFAAFNKAGIVIPFPQRDVHFYTEPVAEGEPPSLPGSTSTP